MFGYSKTFYKDEANIYSSPRSIQSHLKPFIFSSLKLKVLFTTNGTGAWSFNSWATRKNKIKKCPQTAHSVQRGENKVRLKVNTLQIIKWSHMFEELRLELPHWEQYLNHGHHFLITKNIAKPGGYVRKLLQTWVKKDRKHLSMTPWKNFSKF